MWETRRNSYWKQVGEHVYVIALVFLFSWLFHVLGECGGR